MEQNSTIPEEYRDHVSPEKDWKDIVAWVGDLPPLPHVASQALSLIDNPDVSAGKLTSLLGEDPALAARVLKIANSAMFARQREITTLNQAIMVIGFKTLKGLIVAATVRNLNRNFGPIEQMVWQNSTCTAIACRSYATKNRKSYAEEVFLLGLLHDLGKLVFSRQIPEQYDKIIHSPSSELQYNELEQLELGFSHALIGALVAKKWNFSMEMCQIILHHHDPLGSTFENEEEEKTAVVQFCDLVAHANGLGHLEGYPDTRKRLLSVGKLLGLDEEQVDAFTVEVGELYQEMGSSFG